MVVSRRYVARMVAVAIIVVLSLAIINIASRELEGLGPAPLQTLSSQALAGWFRIPSLWIAYCALGAVMYFIVRRILASLLLLVPPCSMLLAKGAILLTAFFVVIYVGFVGSCVLLGKILWKGKRREEQAPLSSSGLSVSALGMSLLSIGAAGILVRSFMQEAYGGLQQWLALSLVTLVAISLLSREGLNGLLAGAGAALGPPWAAILLVQPEEGTAGLQASRGVHIGYVVARLARSRGVEWPSGKPCLSGDKWRWIACGKDPLYIDLESARNQHIIVFGESGSGKSSLAKILAQELAEQGWRVIVFDFHGEYHDLVGRGFVVHDARSLNLNPLELNGETPLTRALELGFMIASLLSLGPLQRSLLIEVIMEAYASKGIYEEDPSTWSKDPPTINDLLNVISERIRTAERRDEAVRLDSIRRQLATLYSGQPLSETQIPTESILWDRVVIDFSDLPSELLQSIHGEVLVRRIYAETRRTGKKTFVIIDEAHRLTKGGSCLPRVLAESRKYGLALILVSQNPLDFPQNILGNAATKISFRITDAKSLEYVTKMLTPAYTYDALNALRQVLKSLPVGHAVLYSDATNNLIVFKTKEYPVPREDGGVPGS